MLDTTYNYPTKGSLWKANDNNQYRIVTITNQTTNNDKYPTTVVYSGDDGKVWSKPLSDWHSTMSLVHEHALVRWIREFLINRK